MHYTQSQRYQHCRSLILPIGDSRGRIAHLVHDVPAGLGRLVRDRDVLVAVFARPVVLIANQSEFTAKDTHMLCYAHRAE